MTYLYVSSGQEDRGWSFRAAWIVLIAVTALAIGDALLAPMPAPRQPDFIDTILGSRAVVVAIRIAIVFAAMFVALSVIALIARRQWLTRVGPVEVGEVVDLDVESGGLDERLTDAHQAIEDLEKRVAITHQLIDREGR